MKDIHFEAILNINVTHPVILPDFGPRKLFATLSRHANKNNESQTTLGPKTKLSNFYV